MQRADNHSPEPERPAVEPEIIPPGAEPRGPRGRRTIWISLDGKGQTARVSPPGLFALIVALLVAGLLVAAALVVLLGALLIWIPIVAGVVAVLVVSGLLRGYWRRLRG
jgi:CHASE2 domain-containing sensor protein